MKIVPFRNGMTITNEDAKNPFDYREQRIQVAKDIGNEDDEIDASDKGIDDFENSDVSRDGGGYKATDFLLDD